MPIRVHARGLDDAPVVADTALAVEDRHVEPRVVGAEPGRPDDGSDFTAREIDSRAAAMLRPRWVRSGVAGPTSPSSPFSARPFVDRVEQPVHLEVGQRALVSQRSRELRLAVR